MQKSLDTRFARIEGQFKKIRADIAMDRDCTEIIPQFLAVRGALASAFEEYVQHSLESCATKDVDKIKQLIHILVK